MIKVARLTVWLWTLWHSASYCQTIPITTNSQAALSAYALGDSLENVLEPEAALARYLEATDLDSTFALAWLRAAMVIDNYENRSVWLKVAMRHKDKVSAGERWWIEGRNAFYGTGEGSLEFGYFKELVDHYPQDARAQYLFGYMNWHHGRSDIRAAISHLEKAVGLDSSLSMAYNELGYACLELGKFDQAKKWIRKYVELVPNKANPLDSYAEVLMRMGDYESSIKAYREVLRIDSNFPWPYFGIAANLNYQNHHREARKIISKAPTNVMSDYQYRHFWRAQVVSFLDEGQGDSAIHMLHEQRKASELGINKREPNFHIYYAFQRATRLLFESKRSEEGMNLYNEWMVFVNENMAGATTRKRVQELADYYWAFWHYTMSEYNQSLMALDRYEENQGRGKLSRILRIRILLATNQQADALQQANLLSSQDYDALYWKAKTLLSNHKTEAAKRLLQQISEANQMNDLDLALVRKTAEQLLADWSKD